MNPSRAPRLFRAREGKDAAASGRTGVAAATAAHPAQGPALRLSPWRSSAGGARHWLHGTVAGPITTVDEKLAQVTRSSAGVTFVVAMQAQHTECVEIIA